MKSIFGWAGVLFCGAVLGLTACGGEGQACKTDGDCPNTEYCGRSGGVFFSGDRCVSRGVTSVADVGGDAEVDVGVDVDDVPQVCESSDECGVEAGTNYRGVCGGEGVCGYEDGVCGVNFVDVDGDAGNGCECEITDLNDVPDLEGVDSNCDGVDGILDGEGANVVFVRVGGDSVGSETVTEEGHGLRPDVAVGTIAEGIARAVEVGRAFVLVSGGDYYGPLKLGDGIGVYGGYDAENGWVRDVDAHETRVLIADDGVVPALGSSKTVIAEGVGDGTIVDGLTIVGATVTAPGASTYAVWGHGAENLVVQNSKIIAGDAGKGHDGKTKGALVCDVPGGIGGMSDPHFRPCYDLENLGDINGMKGVDASGQGGFGGKGAESYCERSLYKIMKNGEVGEPGAAGMNGTHGVVAPDHGGFNEDGDWMLTIGLLPMAGGAGGGGGGGGAGGNYERFQKSNKIERGGAGGGGGRGGCGGSGGGNGTTGGSSFGLVMIGGTVTVRESVIVQGRGGDGGEGSQAYRGQEGADGSSGAEGECSPFDGCASNGGGGGKGGNGGDGGHGAGGHGGYSVGIATFDDASVTAVDGVLFEHDESLAGHAGASLAAPGSGGLVVEIHDFSE